MPIDSRRALVDLKGSSRSTKTIGEFKHPYAQQLEGCIFID